MSVKYKLIIAYLVMIVLSVALLIVGMIQTTRQMAADFTENVLAENTFEDVATSGINTLVTIEYVMRHEPELFYDEAYMMALEENVNGLNMALFVEADDTFVYSSHIRPDIPLAKLADTLTFENMDKGMDHHDIKSADFTANDHYYFVLKRDVSTEGQQGAVYFVYEARSQITMHWNMYGGMYRFVLLIILFIIASMTFIISNQVIKPLKRIEKATEDIRQGNLDFSMKSSRKDEFGHVMNAFDTMREELKSSIDQQVQYEENRKELIASISHDLKTPITSIKGYVEGIRDGIAADEEKMDRYLEVIYQKSRDMDKLIDDLFLFSKLDLNRVPFDFKEVPAKRFFDDSGDELRMDVEKHGFDMIFENTLTEDVLFKVDQQQFRRVINNVVGNSIKYSGRTKRIEMAVKADSSMIVVTIKDSGKGMSPEVLDKIFDKFYRVDQARNLDVGGSGLGLAIAKQIMDGHGGSIKAESVLGEGTTIIIEIGRTDIDHG